MKSSRAPSLKIADRDPPSPLHGIGRTNADALAVRARDGEHTTLSKFVANEVSALVGHEIPVASLRASRMKFAADLRRAAADRGDGDREQEELMGETVGFFSHGGTPFISCTRWLTRGA